MNSVMNGNRKNMIGGKSDSKKRTGVSADGVDSEIERLRSRKQRLIKPTPLNFGERK